MPLARIDKTFDLPTSAMRRIIRDFHAEMARGLSGKKSSLKMIPAYVDRPTGRETGRFIALDLGGTNFRILDIELKGNGASRLVAAKKVALDKKLLTGTADKLFDFLADSIKTFIKGAGSLGFTFSFPVKQTGIASGTLLRWTKGFKIKGAIGEDVVGLFKEALARKGLANINVAALANDTVGTMVARGYEDKDCDCGVILGTGTNACYREGHMIINIEWGNFNKLHITSYDRQLDRSSDRPGEQILEKMVSGMYLGQLMKLVLDELLPRRLSFKNFKTEYMSAIEGDVSKNLSKISALLKELGVKDTTLDERRLIKRISASLSLRASRLATAVMGAVITKMDPKLSRPHTVAIDGSVYEKHPGFSKNMKNALKELFKEKASRIKMVLTKDGSGKGAAIMAAIAASS